MNNNHTDLENKKKIDDYVDAVKKAGYSSYLGGKLKNREMKDRILISSAILILWIISIFIFYYSGYRGWFNDEISNIINLPKINNTINNNYEFRTPIENEYEFNPDYKIYNNVFLDSKSLCDLCNKYEN